MADFDVNTITVQGAVAIASATAGDKLVIDGCDATTDVLTQAQAVQIATRPASPASTTDTIGLAGSTDNHVYAYASFIRGESTGGDVHSFLLYGHMESDATNVFVVSVASATAPTHIPTSSDVTNRVEIQFELTFSATDEVVTVTDTSMYTTRGEFLILKNRTVTTHAEGQATVGEDQTVYGKKEFMDDMIFNGMYQVQAKTLDGQNTQNFFAFTQNGERQTVGPTVTALTTYNGTSYVSSTTSIGAAGLLGLAGGASFSAEHKAVGDSNATMMARRGLGGAYAGVVVEPTQVTLYTNPAGSSARRTLSYAGGQLTGSFSDIGTSSSELSIYVRASAADIDMYFDATVSDATWELRLTNVNDDKTATLTFYAGADSGGQLTCNAATGGKSKLGTSSQKWGEAHIDKAYINDICVKDILLGDREIYYEDNSGDIYVSGDLIPEDISNYELGSSKHTWLTVYCDSAVTETVTSPSRTCTLKASQGPIGEAKFVCDLDSAPVQARIHTDDADSGEVADFYFDHEKFYAYSSYGHVDLGTQNTPWSEVYADNLHGCIPYPSPSSMPSTNIPPVGSIFLAFMETSMTGPEVTYGSVIDATTMTSIYGITRMGVALFKIPSGTSAPGTEWSTYQSITTGKYVALSTGATTNMNKTLCLMMRIA